MQLIKMFINRFKITENAIAPYSTKAVKRFAPKDVNSRVTIKKFAPNPNKKRITPPKSPPNPPAFEIQPKNLRTNALGIQMLSKPLHDHIFPQKKPQAPNPLILEACKKALLQHNMITNASDYQPDVDFNLPPLEGATIEDHFRKIADEQNEPYKAEIEALIKSIPARPPVWELQEGWTRYVPGEKPERVDFPAENGLVFDVEVCMTAGKAPTLATAVSALAWYAWISPNLVAGESKPVTEHHYALNDLIPMESTENDDGLRLTDALKSAKVIIGHNVSYDRARIKEQYWLNRTGARFVDTMSLHVSVSGITSLQRALLKSKKADDERDDSWKELASLNGLDQIYKLYCNKTLSKQTRDLFVIGTMAEIRSEFQNVVTYCSNDVIATFEVLQNLYPLFLERFPHPVTFAGMLELGTAYLPINDSWNRYVTNSEQTFEDFENETSVLLTRRADEACQYLESDEYKHNVWLWDLDWEVKRLKFRRSCKKEQSSDDLLVVFEDEAELNKVGEKFGDLLKTKHYLSSVNSHLPGYPAWYRKLCPKASGPGPSLLGTSMQVTPKLLALTWEGYPLHFLKGYGWGYLVPFGTDLELVRKIPLAELLEMCPALPAESSADFDLERTLQGELTRREYHSPAKKCDVELESCCRFHRLPHKDGAGRNVGSPLSRDFLAKFGDRALAGGAAREALALARRTAYWRSARARVRDQLVVWLGRRAGAIVPQVVACGTLTRRAVEPTWMTAANASAERVGSELRAMVAAPGGRALVGADVDAQELWIASAVGDAACARMHGATPLGWMTLGGAKAAGTDMHSVTARAVGISRDHAKVINYARIYGAGQSFAERLLAQFNPALGEAGARAKAGRMFEMTKGRRVYALRREFYSEDLQEVGYSRWQAFQIAKLNGKRVEEMFCNPKWIGGTESAMFNQLERIANESEPKTPFLGSRLSRTLEPKSLDDRYLPTRINWVVQSGAVDFLHLMLVCMRWLCGEKIRFCLSFHDEVRYLVLEEDKYEVALAMHVTNLYTRCFCSSRLGIDDLAQSVAFFSSVEVDTVLRKDAKNDCVTPSNPHGLKKGYNVDKGEALDINEAIEKCNAKKTKWYQRLK